MVEKGEESESQTIGRIVGALLTCKKSRASEYCPSIANGGNLFSYYLFSLKIWSFPILF
jgi:hypothetical protein